jgi:hypothetical protein
MASTPSPWKGRAEVFKSSYDEVLAFLKHQDDKIGRVLTALAFLTAAGAALFLFSGHPQVHPLVFDRTIDAADFFFAAFMVSLLFALLAILAAVDPTTQAPRFLGQAGQRETILFYGAIYKAQPNWLAPDEDVERLNEKLAKSFHEDAQELARRAEHKVSRFADSRAFVHVSIVALTLLGIARIDGFDVRFRWWLIASLLVLVAFLPVWDIYWHRHFGFARLRTDTQKPKGKDWVIWSVVLFLAPAIVATGLLVSGGIASKNYPQLVSISYALGSLLLSRFFLRHLDTRPKMEVGSAIVTAVGIALLAFVWIW